MNIILSLSYGPNTVYVHSDNVYSFTKQLPYTHWFEPNKEYTLSFYDSATLTNKLMTYTFKIQNDTVTCLNVDGDSSRCQRNMPPGALIGTNHSTGYKQIGFYIPTATNDTKTVRFFPRGQGNFYVHEENIMGFTEKLMFYKDLPINKTYNFEVYNTSQITNATPILTCGIHVSQNTITCNNVNGSSALCNKQLTPGVDIVDNETIYFYLPSVSPTSTPGPATPTPTPRPDQFPVIFTHKDGPTNLYLIGIDDWIYHHPILKPPSFQYLLTKNKRYNIFLNSTYSPMTAPTVMTIVLDTTDNDVICVRADNQSKLCQKASVPGVVIKDNITTGLKEIEIYAPESPTSYTFDSYETWFNYQNGNVGLFHGLAALLDIIDGYMKFKDLGFTVTLQNLLSTIDSYLGFN